MPRQYPLITKVPQPHWNDEAEWRRRLEEATARETDAQMRQRWAQRWNGRLAPKQQQAPLSESPGAGAGIARTNQLIEAVKAGGSAREDASTIKELQTRLGVEPLGIYGGKTEKAVRQFALGEQFSKVNRDLGTSIDFGSLAEYEGFELKGYVPDVNTGKSGVTVGVGFDLGQFNEKQIRALDLTGELTEKLLPYAGLKLEPARKKLAETGGLKLSLRETQQATFALKRRFAAYVAEKYDGERQSGAPPFRQLTPGQQTVIFSRFYHQGEHFTDYRKAQPFWTAVTSGDWKAAQAELRSYPFAKENWYKTRVNREADLLGSP